MSARIDDTNVVYGRLTAIKFIELDRGLNAIWLYSCECGNQKKIRAYKVRAGEIKSCGCLIKQRVFSSGRKKSQPLYGTKFYGTYHQIKQRCNNPNSPRYKHYGGRGIICLWESFEAFKADMYKSFLLHNSIYGGRQTSIDRIDVNGPYCKENCRWATQKEQSLNRRNNIVLST